MSLQQLQVICELTSADGVDFFVGSVAIGMEDKHTEVT